MTVISLDLIVLVIGLLMYALSTNPKLQEIARIMFSFGLLALLLGADRIVTAIGNR